MDVPSRHLQAQCVDGLHKCDTFLESSHAREVLTTPHTGLCKTVSKFAGQSFARWESKDFQGVRPRRLGVSAGIVFHVDKISISLFLEKRPCVKFNAWAEPVVLYCVSC